MHTHRAPRALDTTLLLFFMLVAAAVLTWILPAGAFVKETVEVPGVGTREVVVPGSFQLLAESSPQGLFAVLMAPIRGIVDAADIVGFVLIVGGTFALLQKTGAVDAGLRRLVQLSTRSAHVERAIIPLFMVLFSLGGAIFGMAEETIPFVLIFVPMARSLGYDTLVGVAIPFIGSQVGFAAAFLNPFTIGVAQGIADIPLFSGIGLRFVLWVIATAIGIAFVMIYAVRVKRAPEMRFVSDFDAYDVPSEVAADFEITSLSRRHKIVLVTFVAGIVLLVIGVIRWGWYIEEIAGLFLGLGIAIGIAGRLSPTEITSGFMDGARALVVTAIIIGFARGILVVLTDGQVVDTMLASMATSIAGIGPAASALMMYIVQTVLNFFVPSGSGQAALTMPIMSPLADLVGVSRQVAVLAFQLGDGFTNMIIPTNAVLIGGLALAGIPWSRWAKWVLPLQGILFLLSLLVLTVAVSIGYGVEV